jgi:hypothetical protein
MNFKFDIDKQNEILKLEVSIERKRTAGDARIKIGWPTIKALVEEKFNEFGLNPDWSTEYSLAKDYHLGECKNPVQGLDNAHADKCIGVWMFDLVPKNPAQTKVLKKAVDWKKTAGNKKPSGRPKKTSKKAKEE